MQELESTVQVLHGRTGGVGAGSNAGIIGWEEDRRENGHFAFWWRAQAPQINVPSRSMAKAPAAIATSALTRQCCCAGGGGHRIVRLSRLRPAPLPSRDATGGRSCAMPC